MQVEFGILDAAISLNERPLLFRVAHATTDMIDCWSALGAARRRSKLGQLKVESARSFAAQHGRSDGNVKKILEVFVHDAQGRLSWAELGKVEPLVSCLRVAKAMRPED